MSFSTSLERHRRSLLTIAFALGLAGIFAAISLPVGLFPVTSFPRIRIEVDAGSMPARQMLVEATEPLEQVARAVPGAQEVMSTTSRGSAEIFVNFPWGYDMNQALLAVDAAFAQQLPSLPQGTSYDIIQMSPNVIMPFVSYALTSKSVSPSDLRQLAQYQIVPLLTGIPGVRRVGVLGGQTPEVQVSVDPNRLRAYGLTLADVSSALSRSNSIQAVGRLEDNDLLYLAINNNAFTSIDSVRGVALHTGSDGIVRLGDIAKVTLGTVPQWMLVDDNGKPAVTFDVYQQDSADSLSLATQVQQRLDAFMKTQPGSIELYKWYDQTQLVSSSISALEEAILIGLVFAALVLLAFLRNWRMTLVAMMVVPLSVLVTVLLLSLLGMTLNIMTLGGIAAAIGLLIDDVIVMIEHIARRTGVPGVENPRATVLEAAREFLSPLCGSSLATIIVFAPLAFLSGITGAFFKFLSLTMASALVISFILTAFTAPLLARGIIDFSKFKDPSHGKETWLKRFHGRLLGRLFARPLLLVPGVAVLLAAGFFAYLRVGTGFLPRMDEGGFVLDYYTSPGTSLAETNRELAEVEAILKNDHYVYTYSRRTGAGLGGDLAEAYQGDFFVRLIDPSKRPTIWRVMDEINGKVASQVPGINVDVHLLMSDMIGDMVGRPQPVVVSLSGKDPAVLGDVATKVAAAISKVSGIEPSSVNDGVVPAGDALDIHVDPAAAAMEGLTPADVASQVNQYLYGEVVTRYLGTVEDVGVRLWLDPPQRKIYRDELGNLPIRSGTGKILRLATVATVTFVAGQPQLTRDNLAQVVAVTAELTGGHDLGSTIAAVQKTLAAPGLLPPGVYYSLGGQYQQEQEAVHGMMRVFAAALVAEFILLLFLYERFWLPVIIIASSLVSTGAVFIGLWLTGVELNITAMMGMVMIIGISTEMAIFLVSEYRELERKLPPRQALQEAALNRLRPITMSTLAMILALVPLGAAISGSGDQILQPLAIAIIAGALVQLPLVLLAMPVVVGLTLRQAGAAPG
ncbi:MAG TPA: efflux RND transporter permease subunit [Steroidobacteraceae bacterium]|jgi:multidrug efflux pump subunit AcrB|nr:efflux RND transporter permease subunit [Steroidobacteraceae bacterium]